MIRLIVGLANPGKEYQNTRHNAGAWLIEQLCADYYATLSLKSTFHSQYTKLTLNDSLDLHVAIPVTFMNHSGRTVGALTRYYKIAPEEILVVHDELDFEPGIARLKWAGGLGGHNGLKDIASIIQSRDFWRLRIGIGHPGEKRKVLKYVLEAPKANELINIQRAIENALAILPDLCNGEDEKAMQMLHSK